MAAKRYITLEAAAEIFAIPLSFLSSKLRLNGVVDTDTRAPGTLLVNLQEAARVLKVPVAIINLVEQGREWLMVGKEIESVYGHDKAARDRISGGPVCVLDNSEVYQVSPFIQWLALDPREQKHLLEGKHGKVENKRVRGKV